MANGMVTDTRERLKELMIHYGVTQADICKRADIDKTSISKYLNGTRVPRLDKVVIIAETFGVSVKWLLGYDVEMIEKKEVDYFENSKKNLIETNTSDIQLADHLCKYVTLSTNEREMVDSIINGIIKNRGSN